MKELLSSPGENKQIDPYFEHRLRQSRAHKVIKTLTFKPRDFSEAQENKTLPNPVIEEHVESFAWSEKVVDTIIDAHSRGWIKITWINDENLSVEMLPVTELPETLGHVSELATVVKNLKEPLVMGSPDPETLTYLQTVDFAVEGYMDDEQDGKEYGRVYIDSSKLQEKRNVYLDPESLHVTDYEYGFSFCVKGGIPLESLNRVEVIRARQIPFRHSSDEGTDSNENESDYDEQEPSRAMNRLTAYLAQSKK